MLCDLVSGTPQGSVETEEIAFFSRDEIETLPIDPGRTTKEHILRMFDHFSDPALATEFD